MADVVARLKIDDKDYQAKLEKAKKSTKQFSQEGSTGMVSLAKSFTKFAGAVAASKVAMEAFNGAIKASQTVGDEYTRVVESAKSVTNQFFYAITTGDFTTFDKGLKEMIKNAREATRALDDLGTNRIVLGYLKDKYQAGFQESMTDARNKELSDSERKAAANAARGYLESYAAAIEQDRGIAINAIQRLIVEGGGPANATVEQIDRVLENYNKLGGEYKAAYEQVKRLHDATNALNKMDASYRKTYQGQQKVSAYLSEIAALNKLIGSNTQLYEDAKVYNVFFERWQDEALQTNLQILQSVKQGDRELASWENTLNKVAHQLNNVGNAAKNAVKEFNPGTQAIANLPTASSSSSLPETIGGFAPTAVFAEGSYEAYIAASGASKEYADNLAILKETEVSAAEGLGAISSALGSISGAMDEGGAAWMNYAGNIISAVSSALPALQNLATAQAAAAATGAALNPWTAVAGVTAVASIGAALASLPKFEHGGVIPGTSYTGDKVLIRANSGERVLTREQNAAYERGTALSGKVEFVIRDSVLYGILNRGNAYNSRVYHGR